MGDTMQLVASMTEAQIKRESAEVVNDLARAQAKRDKVASFLSFYKGVINDPVSQKLFGISEGMTLDDVLETYNKLCQQA